MNLLLLKAADRQELLRYCSRGCESDLSRVSQVDWTRKGLGKTWSGVITVDRDRSKASKDVGFGPQQLCEMEERASYSLMKLIKVGYLTWE